LEGSVGLWRRGEAAITRIIWPFYRLLVFYLVVPGLGGILFILIVFLLIILLFWVLRLIL